MKTIEARKVEIMVKRPGGEIETLIHPKIDYMTDGLLALVNKAMADAGRGKITAYCNIDAVVEMEELDYQTRCTRCKSTLDTRTAKSQTEWMRTGGSTHPVIVHYCDSCWHLLSSIGAGEITDLEHRQNNIPSYEPEYKGDF